MTLHDDMDRIEMQEEDAGGAPEEAASAGRAEEEAPSEEAPERTLEEKYKELNDKYLRLYADFENYRKRVSKEKEELAKYATESVLYELLTTIDHLEIALQHAENDRSDGLRQGVEMTLRELMRTLEKFGLKPIEALNRPFDPEFHHAMAQVERDDVEEKTVVEELRKGYTCGDKVLRASMVTVSTKPSAEATEIKYPEDEREGNNISEEEE